MSPWTWWLVAVAVLCAIEVLTLDLVFLMLAGGALAAAGVATVDAGTGAPLGVPAQAVLGLATAAGLLVAVRPVALRHLRQGPALRTGAAAMVGRSALVLEQVDGVTGRVKLAGEVWSARAYDGQSVFEPGSNVDVVMIEGATALVL